MPSYHWIKLWLDILHDPKMGTLSDHLWRRAIELMFAKAQALSESSSNKPALKLVELLEAEPDELGHDLHDLMAAGILQCTETKYFRGVKAEQGPLYYWEFTSRVKRLFAVGCTRPRTGEWSTVRGLVLQRDEERCQYCGEPAGHVDHIIPVCQGGTDEMENLAAACASCNLKKGGRTPAQAGMELLDDATIP